MKTQTCLSPRWIRALLLTGIVGLFSLSVQAEEKADAAVAAAQEWLALTDAHEFKKSWQNAAPLFKEQIKETDWEKAIASVRTPLGKAESRELLTTQTTRTLPGAPQGNYVIIQFKTRFTNKPESVETITPMNVDGTWKVSGYFIK
jgi:hypothetical protein